MNLRSLKNKFLSPHYDNEALLLLRLGFGGTMLLNHGWDKLTNFGSLSRSFPDPLGLGTFIGSTGGHVLSLALCVFAEVVCAAAIVIGYQTRLAAAVLAFTMGVAFFVIHAPDPFNKKELAFVYMIAFVAIYCLGPGKHKFKKF